MKPIAMESFIPKPKNAFMKVTCPGCSNVQVMYSAQKMIVKCLACDTVLAEPSASKAVVYAKDAVNAES